MEFGAGGGGRGVQVNVHRVYVVGCLWNVGTEADSFFVVIAGGLKVMHIPDKPSTPSS